MITSDTTRDRATIIALTLVMGVVAAYLLHAGQGTIPHYDEWDWVTKRRGLSADSLLGAHNGHLSLIPVLLYKALLQVAGIGDYWVFRTALVGLHLGCVVLVFLLARPRVGVGGGAFAAAFAAVLGSAGDDLLWAFQIGFLGAVFFGLGALLALDRGSPRSDAAAAVLLGLALASASVGAAFVVAATVEIAMHPRRRARWWVVAAPLALYGLWYLGYGEGQMRRSNLGDTPGYAADSGSATAGGIVGLNLEYGRLLLLALVGMVALRIWRADRLTPRLLALAAAPVGLWVLTGLSRAQFREPAAPRYIYCGAMLLILLVCELARGNVVPRGSAAALLALLLGFAAVANANVIDATGSFLRSQSADTRARLGALDLVASTVDPGVQFSPVVAPQLFAGQTLSAEKDFGHIGLTPAQLADASAAESAAADEVLRLSGTVTRVAPVARVPSTGGQTLTDITVTGGEILTSGSCVSGRARSSDMRLGIALPAGRSVTITAQAATGVLSRRFADAFTAQPVVDIPAAGVTGVAAAPDVSTVPYHLELASAGNLRVCLGAK